MESQKIREEAIVMTIVDLFGATRVALAIALAMAVASELLRPTGGRRQRADPHQDTAGKLGQPRRDTGNGDGAERRPGGTARVA